MTRDEAWHIFNTGDINSREYDQARDLLMKEDAGYGGKTAATVDAARRSGMKVMTVRTESTLEDLCGLPRRDR